jgi:ubiquinone/menaquinone biosynthesis C-methylase UbiE
MAQITNGVRSILSTPYLYNFFQFIVGANKAQKIIVKEYLLLQDNMKILDVGCGTAKIFNFIRNKANVQYFGYDLSRSYIEFATKKYGSQARFICGDIKELSYTNSSFDVVMANGLLHHLDNNEVERLFVSIAKVMHYDGKVITFDGCYVDNQSKLTKYILSKDRGQNIRTLEEYRRLALKVFASVDITVRYDMLYIPYTHIIMECRHPKYNA